MTQWHMLIDEEKQHLHSNEADDDHVNGDSQHLHSNEADGGHVNGDSQSHHPALQR